MVTHQQAEERVKLGFIIHFGIFLAVVGGLMALNFTRHPEKMWSVWVACGWGAGILLHAALAFMIPQARERAIQQTMQRMERQEQRHEAHMRKHLS